MAKGKEKTGKKPVSNVRKLLEMKKTADAGNHVTPAEKKAAASAMTQAPIKRGGGGRRKAK